MERCPKCKQSCTSLLIHKCPPRWEVCKVDDDEWETIYAPSADEAACRWLEERHRGSGVYEQEIRAVMVRPLGEEGQGTRFSVRMSLEPIYTAVRAITMEE